MDKDIKLQIGVAVLDVLLSKGLPAVVSLVTSLNDQKKITSEDIKELLGALDAEDYFDPGVKPAE